jgi:hypothetical protein
MLGMGILPVAARLEVFTHIGFLCKSMQLQLVGFYGDCCALL